MSNMILSAIPDGRFEPERISSAYDLEIKSLKPDAGMVLIYFMKKGYIRDPDVSRVYLDKKSMGTVWPGTYLFTMIEPGDIWVKASTQVRKEGRGWSRPDWYMNTWGALEAKADNTYYIELLGSDSEIKLQLLSNEVGKQTIDRLELQTGNEYDRLARGKVPHAREPEDICPFGSTVPKFYSAKEIEEYDLYCKFERSF